MSSPIRLALVITELEVGGAEKCLVELATRIDRQRFTPVVYSLGPCPQPPKDALVRRLAEAHVETQFLDLSGWRDYPRGVRDLAARLRQQRAEIVQTFLFHANVLGTRAARKAGVPRTATGIRVADPRLWRTFVERFATRSADRFVCVSQGVADFMRRRGFAARKLVVIPNAIDVDAWANAEPADLQQFGISPGRRAIVYVGRLDPQKRVALMVLSMAKVFHQLPDRDLLIVGDGSERRIIQTFAEGFQPIHFAGWQSDVPRILAACDLLVLASAWEGMPNVVLEAMAAGKPIVATRAEGTMELLGEVAEDQTVDVPQDAAGMGGPWDQFCERIVSIARNDLLTKDLGCRNQQRARDHFSFEAMLAAYERLYFELAGR